MKLKGNTILITGGSAGIGLALAEEFIKLGNRVIVTGRSQARLESAKKKNPDLETYQSDVADPQAIQTTAEEIVQKFPDLNVLINNAGIFLFKNLTSQAADLTKLTQEVDINVAGPIRTTSAYIDTIKKNKGSIINVSSGLAFVPLMCAPIYCATKAALHSYTIALRQQLADTGVEVIELMPPAVKTDLTADLPEDGDFKIISLKELMKGTFAGLRAGKLEIRPGQANQLRFMSRVAPGFIQGQLAKGSKSLVPPPETRTTH